MDFPATTLGREVHHNATGELWRSGSGLPFRLSIRHGDKDGSAFQVEVHPVGPPKEGFDPGILAGGFTFVSSDTPRWHYRVTKIQDFIKSADGAKLTANEYSMNTEEALPSASRVVITCRLTYSGLFKRPSIPSQADASLAEWREGERKRGLLLAIEELESASRSPHSILRVYTPTLYDDFITAGQSAEDLQIEAERKASRDVAALSFASRMPIEWYSLDMRWQRGGHERDLDWLGWTRRPFRRHEPDGFPPLLADRSPMGVPLARLLDAIEPDADTEEMLHTIRLLPRAWTTDSIEGGCALAFAALDRILDQMDGRVNCWSVANTTADAVLSAVRSLIGSPSALSELSEEARAMVRGKVEEFSRPSMKRRIIFHARRLGLDLSQFWPDGVDGGLSRAIRLRVGVIHKYAIEDTRAALADLYRMLTLTERFLISHLGLDDSVLSGGHLSPVNSAIIWDRTEGKGA